MLRLERGGCGSKLRYVPLSMQQQSAIMVRGRNVASVQRSISEVNVLALNTMLFKLVIKHDLNQSVI